MACIALTFHPGTICLKKEMVGCFNITASLDYDCAVVAGIVFTYLDSVRSGHFGMRSKHIFTSGESAE